MLTDFQSINLFPIKTTDVLSNLLMALLCGLALALIYRATYKGPSYSVSFVNALVLLCIIAALVILVIGNNIARAFGLVGAMSIIRFRTAVRDTMDMVFIFLSLAIGMACGVGLSLVAFLGVIVCGFIITAMSFSHFGSHRRRYHLVQVIYDGMNSNQSDFERILLKFCKTLKLVNVKFTGVEQEMEVYYHVVLKKASLSEQLVKELSQRNNIRHVNIFFDEDDVNPPTL